MQLGSSHINRYRSTIKNGLNSIKPYVVMIEIFKKNAATYRFAFHCASSLLRSALINRSHSTIKSATPKILSLRFASTPIETALFDSGRFGTFLLFSTQSLTIHEQDRNS